MLGMAQLVFRLQCCKGTLEICDFSLVVLLTKWLSIWWWKATCLAVKLDVLYQHASDLKKVWSLPSALWANQKQEFGMACFLLIFFEKMETPWLWCPMATRTLSAHCHTARRQKRTSTTG